MVSTKMNSKQKILNSASELFHKYGIEQTSVDRILKDCEVTKSNFYYHFASKEQLAMQVLRNRMDEYIEHVLTPTLANHSLTPGERLSRFYEKITRYHLEMNCENGCPFGNTVVELGGKKEDFRILLRDFFEEWRTIIENCLGEGIITGDFKKDIDPESVSELILSHLEGSILMAKTKRSIIPLQRGSKIIINMITK